MTTIVEDVKLDFCDVLLMPKRSTLDSRSKVDVTRTFRFKYSKEMYTGTPIVAANMDSIGTIEMALAFKRYNMAVALHKFYDAKTLIAYYQSEEKNSHTFYSMGITKEDLEKFKHVVFGCGTVQPKYVCIDVANGYNRKFVSFVEEIRTLYPNVVIMAGNVVTPDMVYDLLERGADIVKVGIGPGSVCTTRKMTGVGFPQLSAILECQDAAHGANGLICGDGGIVVPGDFAKAFAAGSDFVMAGGIFAGHTECGGEIILDCWDEPITMRFYGMSSHEAMDKHYGGKVNYRASEGKVVNVPYKGPVSNTIEEILGGLRSCCTYIGACRLKDLPKCATFVKVSRQLNESLSQFNV